MKSVVSGVIPRGRYAADDEDLAGGTKNNAAVNKGANIFLAQILAIEKLRGRVALVATVVLAALIFAMCMTVLSFTKQIDKATPDVRLVPGAVVSQSEADGLVTQLEKNKDLGKQAPATGRGTAAATVVAGTNTSVSVDISSIANSVVAVISVLVLAITVLAIALLRSTFSLSTHRENPTSASDGEKKQENAVQLPAVEAIKACAEAFAEVVKGVTGKKD